MYLLCVAESFSDIALLCEKKNRKKKNLRNVTSAHIVPSPLSNFLNASHLSHSFTPSPTTSLQHQRKPNYHHTTCYRSQIIQIRSCWDRFVSFYLSSSRIWLQSSYSNTQSPLVTVSKSHCH